jgi:RNA polymerase sigma-70 factor, ECF subfamily
MNDNGPDSVAMERLQRGDDLALNELMSRWQQPLVNFIFRYTANESEAVDLAQETFVRVYEYRHHYKAGGKFSTWLFTIAVNLCRNQARWKSRHPTSELDETIPDAIATPHEQSVRSEQFRRVREAVAALPEELRVTLTLFEFEELSYADIATILKCSIKAVETRIYRAKKILRETLAAT